MLFLLWLLLFAVLRLETTCTLHHIISRITAAAAITAHGLCLPCEIVETQRWNYNIQRGGGGPPAMRMPSFLKAFIFLPATHATSTSTTTTPSSSSLKSNTAAAAAFVLWDTSQQRPLQGVGRRRRPEAELQHQPQKQELLRLPTSAGYCGCLALTVAATTPWVLRSRLLLSSSRLAWFWRRFGSLNNNTMVWMGRSSSSFAAAASLAAFLTSTINPGPLRTFADAPKVTAHNNNSATSTTTTPPISLRENARTTTQWNKTTVESTSTHTTAPSSCPFYGCPIYPTDVHYNTDSIKSLLRQMREVPAEQVTEQWVRERNDNGDAQSHDWHRRDAASLTLIGYKGGPLLQQINQDRAVVVSPFLVPTTTKNRNPLEEKDRILLGVFDGHGTRGELVSEFTVQNLPSTLAQKLGTLPRPTPTATTATSSSSFWTTGTSTITNQRRMATIQALHDTYVELDQQAPADPSGGSTATTILVQDEDIYIANTGDSRSFVVSYRPSTKHVQLLYISREDKPNLPDERARVEGLGGQVYIPKRGTSRVVYQDPITGAPSGLAMSRSIGDWAAAKWGVIADPIVDVLGIPDLVQTALKESHGSSTSGDASRERRRRSANNEREEQCFVVDENGEVDRNVCSDRMSSGDDDDDEEALGDGDDKDNVDDVYLFGVAATDGMMDYLSSQEIAQVLATALFEPNAAHPVTACEWLIFSAANGWQQDKQGRYRDDIAIAVSVLRRPPQKRTTE